MTVRDVVKGSFERAKFDALIDKIEGTQQQPLEGDIPKIVEVTAKTFGFNDGERKSVLDHLIKGGDLSRFGLYNAVTRTAEDLVDYDRASEFERIGEGWLNSPKLSGMCYLKRHDRPQKCISCSRQAAPNRSRCEQCLSSSRASRRRYVEMNAEAVNASQRRARAQMIDGGLCVCGNPLRTGGRGAKPVWINNGLITAGADPFVRL